MEDYREKNYQKIAEKNPYLTIIDYPTFLSSLTNSAFFSRNL